MAWIGGNRPNKKRSTKLGIEHSANGQKPKSLKSGAKADEATQIDLSLISRHGLMVSGTRKEFSTSSQIYLIGPHILIGQKSCPDIDIATWIVTREACFWKLLDENRFGTVRLAGWPSSEQASKWNLGYFDYSFKYRVFSGKVLQVLVIHGFHATCFRQVFWWGWGLRNVRANHPSYDFMTAWANSPETPYQIERKQLRKISCSLFLIQPGVIVLM